MINVWEKTQETNSVQNNLFVNLNLNQEKVDVYLQLLSFLQQTWVQLTTYDEALATLSLAFGLILVKPALGSAFFQAFSWVDAFLKGGDETAL